MSHLEGRRDPRFEREFLEHAERLAGMTNSGFTQEVAARMHRAERELGPDSYLEMTMLKLVANLAEEGLDIGGWSTVIALAAYPKVQDVDKRHQVHLLLQQIAAYGPLVCELCRQLHEVLTD